MIAIPDEFLQYLKEGGSDYSFTDSDQGYIQRWSVDEVVKWNERLGASIRIR